MIVPRYYEDLEILHDNTMPARAYYIPASKKMDDLIEHRETSDRFQLLDKNWKFQYFESIYDVKDLKIWRYYMPGSCSDMMYHNIPISVIHFRLILHMSHRISHAAPMLRFLPIIQMNRHRWHT